MSDNFNLISNRGNFSQTSNISQKIDRAETPQSPLTSAYDEGEGGKGSEWVVVLTTSGVEHKAVEAHLKPFQGLTDLDEETKETGTIYTKGRFITSTCIWNIAVVEIEPSNVNAAQETERAIDYFNPSIVFSIGVASGMPDREVKLGNVVVGTKIYNYQFGKVDKNGIFRAILESMPLAYRLEQRVKAEARNTGWLDRIIGVESNSSKVLLAPIASGTAEVESIDSAEYKLIESKYSDTVAVETNGLGCMEAAHANQTLPTMVIRGISKIIGTNSKIKPSEREKTAACHATAFAFEVLEKLNGSGSNSEVLNDEIIGQYTEGRLNLDLNWKPPASMAILRLEQTQDGWWLRAHHREMSKFEEQGRIDIGSELEGLRLQPWDMGTIGCFERELENCPLGKVLRWLNSLQKKYPQLKSLVIAEPETAHIPWELMNLGNRMLGVSLQTIRVSLVPHNDKSDLSRPLDMGVCCKGRAAVCAMEGLTGRGVVYHQSVELQLYKYEVFTCRDGGDACINLEKLQDEVGWIVININVFGNSLNRQRGYLRAADKIFRKKPLLVILENISNNHSLLANSLLKHGAEGVLLMLSPMDRDIELTVAKRFLEKQRELKNIPIPEILRAMREESSGTLESCINDTQAENFIAVSRIAYYGHPMTTIELEEMP
jgi:nucleoside phosphorylase